MDGLLAGYLSTDSGGDDGDAGRGSDDRGACASAHTTAARTRKRKAAAALGGPNSDDDGGGGVFIGDGDAPAEAKAKKRKRRVKASRSAEVVPELPDMFRQDDATRAGRTRHVAHCEGMWSGYVYLQCGEAVSEALRRALPREYRLTDPSSWAVMSTPHVSLSRQLYLQKHEIAMLAADLGAALAPCAGTVATFTHAQTLVNDEGDTEFLAAVTHDPCIASLIDTVDAVLKDMSLPRYYTNPVLHATLATRPRRAPSLGGAAQTPPVRLATPVSLPVEAVRFRAGNKTYTLPLQ